jgi:hypothetical protein
VATNLNLKRRGAPGSGLPGLDVVLKMLIFVTALICGAAIIFAGIPAALYNANRIHIENGREPNAGVAFMPELIVIVCLWWGIGAALEYFFDLPVALVSLSIPYSYQHAQTRRVLHLQ